MKRFLILILAILYMGASTGATFHMHYCMGELVNVQLWHNEAEKCSKCRTNQCKACARNCCKDEHKTVKLEKDQKVTENTIHFIQLVSFAIPVSFIDLPLVYPVSMEEEYPISNGPPRSSNVSSHILNCTFRI